MDQTFMTVFAVADFNSKEHGRHCNGENKTLHFK